MHRGRPPLRILLGLALLVALPRTLLAEKVVLVAGGDEEKDGVAAARARLHGPFGTDFASDGTLLIVEMTGQRVRGIDSQGVLSTIAGTGEKGSAGDGGPARQATFNGMHHLAVARQGDIYLADTWNNCVRRIDPRTGVVSRFAGTGTKGFGGDGGPAAKAQFGGVYCLAFTPAGDRLYIADLDNRRIRAIDMAAGTVDTVAGNGKKGEPEDGADARQSPLVDPRAVAADGQGNVYILERSGDALRVVDAAGHIRTVAGRGAANCRDENGGQPQPMKGPKHLCVDRDGSILIADTENHLIRRYLPKEQKLVRVAGTGKPGAGGVDGPPLEAQLKQPHGVFVDRAGTLYIADSSNDRVLKIVP